MNSNLINFPNNAKLVLTPVDTKALVLTTFIGQGIEHESKKLAGVSKIIERLINMKLNKLLLPFGAIIETYTTYEHIEITISTIKDFTKDCIIALSNTLFDFAPKLNELEYAKRLAKVEINNAFYNPTFILNTLNHQQLYKGTGLANSVIGTIQSLDNMSLVDVTSYYHKILRPENLFFSITGDVYDDVSSEKNPKSNIQNMTERNDNITNNSSNKRSIYDILKDLDNYDDDDDDDEDILLDTEELLQNTRTNNNQNTNPSNVDIKNENIIEFQKSYFIDKNIKLPLPNWNNPEFSIVQNAMEMEIDDKHTFDNIHLLIVKYLYGKTINLNAGKHKLTSSAMQNRKSFNIKTRSLNQARFMISFPSAPYDSTGYKYTLIFEQYLERFLKSEAMKINGVYLLNVDIEAYKNNANLNISFAADDDNAIDIYQKIIKLIKGVKAQTMSRSEFESYKNWYLTNMLLSTDKMNVLSRNICKYIEIKNTVFNLANEIESIKRLDYETYKYLHGELIDTNRMCVSYVGRKKEKFDPLGY